MNELKYISVGDYYILDIKLPKENRSIGRWWRMHREYIKEHNPAMFNDLVLTGRFGLILLMLTNRHRID